MKSRLKFPVVMGIAALGIATLFGILIASAQTPPYVEVQQDLMFPEIPAKEVTEDLNGNLCWAAPFQTTDSITPVECTRWAGPGHVWARFTPDQIEMARGAADGVALWPTGPFTITYSDGVEQVCSSAVITASHYHLEIPSGVEVGEGPLWGGDSPDCTYIPQKPTEPGVEVAVHGTTPATLQLLVDGNLEWEGTANNSDALSIPIRNPYNNWVQISTAVHSPAGRTEQTHGYKWVEETQPYPEISNFEVFPTSGEEPLEVTATAKITGTPPLVVIDWGDQSDISTIAEPEGAVTETNVFSEGTFTVKGWTVDQYGINSTPVTKTVTVTSTTPPSPPGGDDDEEYVIYLPLAIKAEQPEPPTVSLSGGNVLFFPEKPVQETTKDMDGNPCLAAPYISESSTAPDSCTHWTGTAEVWAEWTQDQIDMAQGDAKGVALWGSGQFTVTYGDGTEKICGSALLAAGVYHLQITEGTGVGEGVLLEGDTTDCSYIAPQADQAELAMTVTGQVPVTVTVLAGDESIWEGKITEAGTSTINLSLPKGWSEIKTTVKSAMFEEIYTHGWLWGGD